MKNIFTASLVLISAMVLGQNSTNMSTKANFGFGISQFQKDFGLGVQLTSPYIIKDHLAIRLRANLMFNENVISNLVTWTPYSNYQLGIIGVGGTIEDFLRLYGEGGFLLILPSSDITSTSHELGGYGLFGFEFYMAPRFNYFIELGGVGSGARADKLNSKPIYSNGFLINVGFRAHL